MLKILNNNNNNHNNCECVAHGKPLQSNRILLCLRNVFESTQFQYDLKCAHTIRRHHTINRRIKPNEKCNDMPDVHFVQDADVVVIIAERQPFTECM